MEIIKLNSRLDKFYKPWAKVESIPLPDGTEFITKELLDAPELEGIADDVDPIKESETKLEYLPKQGEQCEDGVVYKLQNVAEGENDLVICRQTHIRTEHDVKIIPALFSFFRENSDDLEWIPNETVELGWKRIYNGVIYECIQAHMTLESWTPDNTPTLWKAESTGEVGEWKQPTGGHDAYSIGDRVTFNGSTYESVINGNVWSPTAYPQGWKKL